jgi:hypothetical protein
MMQANATRWRTGARIATNEASLQMQSDLMKTSAHPASTRRHALPSEAQRSKRGRHQPEPLNDNQYVATSLALIAQLTLRVRVGARRHG